MGGAVIAILLVGVVLLIVLIDFFQRARNNMRETKAVRQIEEKKSGEIREINSNKLRIAELYSKEVQERDRVRAINPVIDVGDFMKEQDGIYLLTGMAKESALVEFYKKYQKTKVYSYNADADKNQELNNKARVESDYNIEFLNNNFYVSGKVVDKVYGQSANRVWLTKGEHNIKLKSDSYSTGLEYPEGWELILDIGDGKLVGVFNYVLEKDSEEGRLQSKMFEGISIGAKIEATGILSIPNEKEDYKPDVRGSFGQLACVYNTKLLTIRAPLSGITIQN